MKKERWLFLLKLTCLVVLLGYGWVQYQVYYPAVLGPVFLPVLAQVGVDRWYMALLLDHFTTWLPFAALVLASPDPIAQWKRHLRNLSIGLGAILLSHFLLSWAIFEIVAVHCMNNTYYKLSLPLYFVNDALPLALWVWLYLSLIHI